MNTIIEKLDEIMDLAGELKTLIKTPSSKIDEIADEANRQISNDKSQS